MRYAGAGQSFERGDNGFLSFPAGSTLHPLFFAGRQHSPTDRPEHFAHANTADSLIGVWLAPADLPAFRRLMAVSQIAIGRERVCVPRCASAEVARMQEGEVVILPAFRQRAAGRLVVGATVRVRSLAAARLALKRGGLAAIGPIRNGGAVSVFLPPDIAPGLWLEFRQIR